MSYSSRESRPDTRYRSSSSSGRRTSTGSRQQGGRSRNGSSRNRQGGRSGRSAHDTHGGSSSRSRSTRTTRNLTGPDTGYTLHSHRVNYSRRNGDPFGFVNGRFILLVIIVIVVVVVLIAGISSCVSGPSTSQEQTQQTEEQTETKPRVASGLSSELTSAFNAELDRDELMAQIAQNADQYDDERLLTLALNEPEAVSFVANYLTADKSASSYTDTVTQGQVPQLFDWDTRWGYVSYGDGCIGVTGSGPTTVAMAYMGLTGKSDKTPATIAQGVSTTSTSTSSSSNNNSASSNSNSSNSNSSTSSSTTASTDSADSMIALMSQAGLDATQYDSSSDTLEACLSSTSVAAVYIEENGLQDNRDAHWALVVGMNSDGTLNVFDPTSSEVSARTWDSSTIARASSTILYVTVSESAQGDEGSTTSDTDSTYGTTSSDTSGTSSASSSGSGTSSSQGSSTSGTSSSTTSDSSGSSGTSGSGSSTGTSGTSSSTSSGSSSSGSSSSGDYIGL